MTARTAILTVLKEASPRLMDHEALKQEALSQCCGVSDFNCEKAILELRAMHLVGFRKCPRTGSGQYFAK